jgi:hypothetical protein
MWLKTTLHIATEVCNGGTFPPFEVYQIAFDGANVDTAQGISSAT